MKERKVDVECEYPDSRMKKWRVREMCSVEHIYNLIEFDVDYRVILYLHSKPCRRCAHTQLSSLKLDPGCQFKAKIDLSYYSASQDKSHPLPLLRLI